MLLRRGITPAEHDRIKHTVLLARIRQTSIVSRV